MSDHYPASLWFLENFVKKIKRMHIGCLTDVYNVLVLDKCAEYLEKSCDVE